MNHRIFTALCLEYFESELTTYISKIDSRISGVKWSRPGQFHVTLHFFAALNEAQIDRLKIFCRETCSQIAAPKVGLESLGGFPDLKHPRVIWSGLTGDTDLVIQLQKQIQEKLLADEFPVESREFKPHLTLARSRRGGVRIPLGLPLLKTHPHRVRELTLFESHLENEGSRYEVLDRFPFASVL